MRWDLNKFFFCLAIQFIVDYEKKMVAEPDTAIKVRN